MPKGDPGTIPEPTGTRKMAGCQKMEGSQESGMANVWNTLSTGRRTALTHSLLKGTRYQLVDRGVVPDNIALEYRARKSRAPSC